jgi:hypothetical protein
MTLLGDHAALCIRPQQHAEDPDRVRAAILRLLYSYNARASLTAIFPIVTSDAVNRHHHPRHCVAFVPHSSLKKNSESVSFSF